MGAEALAAALRRGALSTLVTLVLDDNPIGSEGMAALAAPLHKLPRLNELLICCCEIGDAGMASLVGSLGKNDFKALEFIWLRNNNITDAGMATLAAALDAGWLPNLQANVAFFLIGNPASAHAEQAVLDALYKRHD